jgi:hypothetical protein
MRNIRLNTCSGGTGTCSSRAVLTAETEDGRTIGRELDFSSDALTSVKYGAYLVIQGLAEIQMEERTERHEQA